MIVTELSDGNPPPEVTAPSQYAADVLRKHDQNYLSFKRLGMSEVYNTIYSVGNNSGNEIGVPLLFVFSVMHSYAF